MREWMNIVGMGLPIAIRLTQDYMYKGDPAYKTWYGRYCIDKSFVEKVKLIMKNG